MVDDNDCEPNKNFSFQQINSIGIKAPKYCPGITFYLSNKKRNHDKHDSFFIECLSDGFTSLNKSSAGDLHKQTFL